MKTKNPVAVLIHGHHLQAPSWEELVWGSKNLSQVGRVPRAMHVAFQEGAELLIWGTGASEDPESGKKESEYTQALALERINELAAYLGIDTEVVSDFIQKHSVLQMDSNNTKDEIRDALATCKERGIQTLYLVSSPTHVPRCLLTALQIISGDPTSYPQIYAVAADTTVDFWHPSEVAVVEPSHRPDRSEAPFNLLAKRMASARKFPEPAMKLYEQVRVLIDAFEQTNKKSP